MCEVFKKRKNNLKSDNIMLSDNISYNNIFSVIVWYNIALPADNIALSDDNIVLLSEHIVIS
jgi:hypothetical protein